MERPEVDGHLLCSALRPSAAPPSLQLLYPSQIQGWFILRLELDRFYLEHLETGSRMCGSGLPQCL